MATALQRIPEGRQLYRLEGTRDIQTNKRATACEYSETQRPPPSGGSYYYVVNMSMSTCTSSLSSYQSQCDPPNTAIIIRKTDQLILVSSPSDFLFKSEQKYLQFRLLQQ